MHVSASENTGIIKIHTQLSFNSLEETSLDKYLVSIVLAYQLSPAQLPGALMHIKQASNEDGWLRGQGSEILSYLR